MPLSLRRIDYRDLNARQKENFNYQKVSAMLADYGFTTIRLTDDWQGADFIAQHIDGETYLKVQLKSRLTFSKKYIGKDIIIAFFHDPNWYLYPHDELLNSVFAKTGMSKTYSWSNRGNYSFPRLSKLITELLKPYTHDSG